MMCQHEGCRCMAQPEESFCSEYCKEHGSEQHDEHACKCGHPECEMAFA
jgi:hypothetical protein